MTRAVCPSRHGLGIFEGLFFLSDQAAWLSPSLIFVNPPVTSSGPLPGPYTARSWTLQRDPPRVGRADATSLRICLSTTRGTDRVRLCIALQFRAFAERTVAIA